MGALRKNESLSRSQYSAVKKLILQTICGAKAHLSHRGYTFVLVETETTLSNDAQLILTSMWASLSMGDNIRGLTGVTPFGYASHNILVKCSAIGFVTGKNGPFNRTSCPRDALDDKHQLLS